MTQQSDQIATREADAFLRQQPAADVAAAHWHTRAEQGLSSAEDAQFRQWLAADPAHEAAFLRLDRGLQAVRALPAEHIARLRRRDPTAQPAHQPSASSVHQPSASPAPQRPPGRQTMRQRLAGALTTRQIPAALAFCCVTLIAVGAGWKLWQSMPTFSATYTAERGQRRDIALPDGTQLTLDSSTRVDVALYRDRREVRLAQGQAMFSVARDAARPFDVLAGPARVTVLGTRFAVHCKACAQDHAQVEVAVEEGHVRVTGQRGVAELRAGQMIAVDAQSGLGPLATLQPGAIAPWRKGLLRFTSTPLAEAIQEFERYAPVRLLVRDPAVAAMPIGGSYQANNPAAFAEVLPHILPVRLVRRADGNTEVLLSHPRHSRESGNP